MKVNFYWHSYKYFPYEQELAVRELSALLGQKPLHRGDYLSIDSLNGWKSYAQRTTYFREAVADDGSRVIPLQSALEISTKSYRQPILFDVTESRQPTLFDVTEIGEFPINADAQSISMPQSLCRQNRQNTRYSAHGLHEYRGKFNPQIVRVIGNMLGLQPGDWVLDPFGGSGTTLLEAAHVGWNAISIDINPLAIQISRAKIASMYVSVEELQEYTQIFRKRLIERSHDISFNRAFTESEIKSIGGENWQACLPNLEYLSSWFTKSILVQLGTILNEIARIPSENIQLIFQIVLSDIVRDISLQDPGDLRIRRRKSAPENMAAIPLYLDDLKSKIETILQARQYIPNVTTTHLALSGDSRYCDSTIRTYLNISESLQFDGAITSPPYATALPYIDTQRLSLVLFGLINPDEIRTTEKNLTGNREITIQERIKLENAIDINADRLPDECIHLCQRLKKAVDKNKDGFRRQNVPALLYKYLVDMLLMFRHVHPLLKINAPFALVVGQNQTRLGGQLFVIDTPNLLIQLATHNGFALQEALKLDTYQRFDIHQENSIRSEALIILRKIEHAN